MVWHGHRSSSNPTFSSLKTTTQQAPEATTAAASKVWEGNDDSVAVTGLLETMRSEKSHTQRIAAHTHTHDSPEHLANMHGTAPVGFDPLLRYIDNKHTANTLPQLSKPLWLCDSGKWEIIRLTQLHRADVCNYSYWLHKSQQFIVFNFLCLPCFGWGFGKTAASEAMQWARSIVCVPGLSTDDSIVKMCWLVGEGELLMTLPALAACDACSRLNTSYLYHNDCVHVKPFGQRCIK